MALPIKPPIEPMLARISSEIPAGNEWLYEPKWDGFRAIVFFDGEDVHLQSRDLKPLQRYFPELQASLAEVLPHPMVLDGEVVVMTDHGLDWEALSQRIHPAESRVRKLAAETPSSFVAFDMLADGTSSLMATEFRERRARLELTLADVASPAFLTPATRDRETALDWSTGSRERGSTASSRSGWKRSDLPVCGRC